MLLTERDFERYKRQLLIPDFGEDAQLKLKQARVSIAGAGGLGSTVAPILAAAGVGHIDIIDCDTVNLSNLNRQFLHCEKDIGRRKVYSAYDTLHMLNGDIVIKPYNEKITYESAMRLFKGTDAIVDCLDNFEARFALNLVSVKKGIPLFHGACFDFEGHIATLIPPETACLECFINIPPKTGNIPVAGFTPALVGSIQAAEVVKYFTGIGELLTGEMLIMDCRKMMFEKIKLKKFPNCPVCGKKDDVK